MKNTVLMIAFITLTLSLSAQEETPKEEFNISIPTGGNSWVLKDTAYISSDIITSEGIRNWSNKQETVRTFFYVDKPGKISIGINAKVEAGKSKVEFIFGEGSTQIIIKDDTFTEVYIGEFELEKPGYHFVDIKGVKKEGLVFADISSILIKAEDPNSIKFTKDDFYFGRRGPSDHLNFEIPEEVDDVEWFYSEIIIPNEQDVVGSYFMANGFKEGYFGIQVNSLTERRILFSIWSPFKTDNPGDVPEDYKIKLVKKGEGVHTDKFGDEGSGGQSYKIFNWKPGIKYGFLVGAKPTKDGSTDFVAYFYNPESTNWMLIAEFRRPKTTTYLKGLYSFLENFIPHQGVFERRGLFQNQWVYSANRWHEITKASFTADNTARKENRFDYSGGNDGEGFYLQNCGFTNDKTTMGAKFEREGLNREPNVNFKKLEWL